MFSERTLESVRSLPVLDVAELYVRDLKKAGSVYKGFSPFNEEKTPSFVVSEQKNIWHDFSAGVGGDAIKLVMDMERLSFAEAVEKLCEMFGIEVEYEKNYQSQKKYSSSALEEYNEWCILNLKKRKDVIAYLTDRGVSRSSIEKFEIGFAPASRETVRFVLENLNAEEAKVLGIIDEGSRGLYARFIDRIMFPVRDHTGKLCGFSGRTFSNHPAKYVNTPDTPIFKKSKLLYGFNIAKTNVAKTKSFLLCEGQMDVVLMHQAGFENAFASMGTSLTEEHVKLIGRHAISGTIAYDGDSAGVRAALKAACMFSERAISTKIVTFDYGEDPADIIAEGRIDELRTKLGMGVPAVEFCVNSIASEYDTSDPFQKQKAYDAILKEASRMHAVVRQSMLEYATKILGVVRKVESKSKDRGRHSGSILLREKELIKAAMDSEEKRALLYEARKCFRLKEEIEKLAKEELDDESLTEIYLDETIGRSKDFVHDLMSIKIACLTRYIAAVRSSKTMSFEEKVRKTREAQVKIDEMKQKMKGDA